MTLEAALHALSRSLGGSGGRRGLTLGLVLLSVASAALWGTAAWQALRLAPPAAAPRSGAVSAPPTVAELARLLGATPEPAAPAVPAAQRFVLLGVVASVSGQGLALMAVDGQPARPFAVGAELAPGFVLQRLAAREVRLGASLEGPVILRLPLPDGPAAPTAPASAGRSSSAPTAPEPGSAAQPPAPGAQSGP